VKRATLAKLLAPALLLATTSCSGTLDQLWPDDGLFTGKAKPGRIVRIAVLPFAYRDAGNARTCDLCPDRLVMDKTSEDAALLVTAFFYEALAKHPRMQVVPYERIRELQGADMRETITRVSEAEDVEMVLVGAVLELRDRIGDPRSPQQRGGAAIYAAALQLPSGKPLWKRVYDRTPRRSSRAMREYELLVVGEESRAKTAEEVAEDGVQRMVASLADTVN